MRDILLDMEEIKCLELWKDWMLAEPENYQVVAAKERISKYSKDDWKIMSGEAIFISTMLGELSSYNIPVESKVAEYVFDAYAEHYSKWFFTLDKLHVIKLSILCSNDHKYEVFFNKFGPELNKYMSKLLRFYLYKVSE